jgi:hypothetical protein
MLLARIELTDVRHRIARRRPDPLGLPEAVPVCAFSCVHLGWSLSSVIL